MNKKSRTTLRNQRFNETCLGLLDRLGATPTATFGYSHQLETLAGPLLCKPEPSDSGPWLACRFTDVEQAKRWISGPLNPYSGKWNLMTDDLAHIERELQKILGPATASPLGEEKHR